MSSTLATLPKELVQLICYHLGYRQAGTVARCCRYLAFCVRGCSSAQFFQDAFGYSMIERSLLDQEIPFCYKKLLRFHHDLQSILDSAQERLLKVTDDIINSINNGYREDLLDGEDDNLPPFKHVENCLEEGEENLHLEFVPLAYPLVVTRRYYWMPRLNINIARDMNHTESMVLLESFEVTNQPSWWITGEEEKVLHTLPLTEKSYSFSTVTDLVQWMRELPNKGYILTPYASAKECAELTKKISTLVRRHRPFFLVTDASSDWVERIE